jgi:hypothetical protein
MPLQPVTPPQTAPLIDDVYAQRTWYLFFDQLKQAASTGGGIVQYGTSTKRLALPTQGLPNGALWWESDTGLIYLWNGPSLKWLWIAGTQIGTNAQRLALSTQSLPNGGLWYESDTGLTYTWKLANTTWTYVAGTQIIDQTLTAPTTIAAPTTGARDLVVILRQDATGGRTITWGANFSATSASIDTTASTISVFLFVLSGAGLYVMVGQPTTGMTP